MAPNQNTLVAQLKAAAAWDQALACLAAKKSTSVLVADRYDDDETLREAIGVLMPDFEYPDIAHLTLAELHRRCRKQLNPAIVLLKQLSMKAVLASAPQQ